MRRLAAVLCQDAPSLHTLQISLSEVGMAQTTCRSHQEAMQLVLGGYCAALIVDFDLPQAAAVVKTAALLAPPYKPLLLTIAGSRGSGRARLFSQEQAAFSTNRYNRSRCEMHSNPAAGSERRPVKERRVTKCEAWSI